MVAVDFIGRRRPPGAHRAAAAPWIPIDAHHLDRQGAHEAVGELGQAIVRQVQLAQPGLLVEQSRGNRGEEVVGEVEKLEAVEGVEGVHGERAEGAVPEGEPLQLGHLGERVQGDGVDAPLELELPEAGHAAEHGAVQGHHADVHDGEGAQQGEAEEGVALEPQRLARPAQHQRLRRVHHLHPNSSISTNFFTEETS